MDAHEKIVLGALIKKAGLDICRVDDQSINYDRELILGGLLWLAHVLTAQPVDVVTVTDHGVLRDVVGRAAGNAAWLAIDKAQ